MRRATAKALIEQGKEQEIFVANLDPEATIDLLYSSIYLRLLVGHAPLDTAFSDHIVDYWLQGMVKRA